MVSLLAGDFYKMPISVAFIAASVYAVAVMRRMPFAERIGHFSRGASDPNIMLMIWIFVLAGAFAESARSMGAVDATVALTPPSAARKSPSRGAVSDFVLRLVLDRNLGRERSWRWSPWPQVWPVRPA